MNKNNGVSNIPASGIQITQQGIQFYEQFVSVDRIQLGIFSITLFALQYLFTVIYSSYYTHMVKYLKFGSRIITSSSLGY